MKIYSVLDKEFAPYGKVLEGYDTTCLMKALDETTPLPEGVDYVASVASLESTCLFGQLQNNAYGGMPIQIGYCNGHNSMLNALEYHKDSEINVMATDAILLLGLRSELEDDFTYDTGKVKAFFVPAGTAVEIYATSLHYAPCGVAGEGYQVAIVLPKGTNYPFVEKRDRNAGEDRMMTAVNKWVIGHPEGGLDDSCFLGLKGENLSVL